MSDLVLAGTGGKRRMSPQSEPDAKKMKSDDDVATTTAVASAAGGRERQGKGDDNGEGDGSDTGDSQSSLLDDGPHVFFLYADALVALLAGTIGTTEDHPVLRLRSAVMDAYARVASLPEADRETAIANYVGGVRQWDVESEAVALATQAAERAVEALQREEPEEDIPRIEVRLMRVSDGTDEGVWWLTQIELADAEGDRAMSCALEPLLREL